MGAKIRLRLKRSQFEPKREKKRKKKRKKRSGLLLMPNLLIRFMINLNT
jgi:hypothetical protein